MSVIGRAVSGDLAASQIVRAESEGPAARAVLVARAVLEIDREVLEELPTVRAELVARVESETVLAESEIDRARESRPAPDSVLGLPIGPERAIAATGSVTVAIVSTIEAIGWRTAGTDSRTEETDSRIVATDWKIAVTDWKIAVIELRTVAIG